MGTTPWHTDHQASSGSDQLAKLREVVRMSNALLYFTRTRKPRSNSDKTIKPASAVGILLGMQRVLPEKPHQCGPFALSEFDCERFDA